ncbi:hypothetical protein TRVA0_009S01530 [Trichomonascus vanleenenianus]|uniref:uncharacterized protein n=1 Tax=Trichomonascus vanleenenianus TaxID=2268995 RepID=UPI003EC983F6
MTENRPNVTRFFAQDIQSWAPREAATPNQEDIIEARLWNGLQVEFGPTEITFRILVNRVYVYRVPLVHPEDLTHARDRFDRISVRMSTLALWGCINRVEVRFLSQPPTNISREARCLMGVLSSCGRIGSIERLDLVISQQTGDYALDIISGLYEIGSMRLVLVLQADRILTNCIYLDVLLSIRRLRGWERSLELYVQARQISIPASEVLARFVPNLRHMSWINRTWSPNDEGALSPIWR